MFNSGLEEVDKPSFHSETPDNLSQAVWVIVYDGTPEEKRQRAHKTRNILAGSQTVLSDSRVGDTEDSPWIVVAVVHQ